MDEYVELIDKYRIVQSKDTDYNPPSYDWVDNTGEIVRCRNCIHYKPQQRSARWSCTTPMCTRSATIKMPPDGFCSFGEKREES